MEMASTHYSLAHTRPQSCFASLADSKLFSQNQKSVSSINYGLYAGNSKWVRFRTPNRILIGPIQSSSGPETTSKPGIGAKWIFEPAGDGDWRHIGKRVSIPDAFEIASNVVTVGRVPERVDVVIPVATVSGVHAQIEKKDGNLYVTDLDSTNGTFIDEKRLRPGIAYPLPSGSYVIFGDIHLALFQARKLKISEVLEDGGELEIVDAVTISASAGAEPTS